MPQWWSYSLEDLVLFSDRAWYSLLESYHRDHWPLQLAAKVLAIAVLVLLLLRPPQAARLLHALLAATWAWVAWAFLHQRLAPLHWIADWYAIAFGLQALLLIAAAADAATRLDMHRPSLRLAAAACILAGLFLMPAIVITDGRSWWQAELFGMTPDATVMVSLGVIALLGRTWLLLIPLAWCLVSAATNHVLGLTAYWLLPAAALLLTAAILVDRGGVAAQSSSK